MKLQMAAIAIVAGCVSGPALRPAENCAADHDMALGGVSIHAGDLDETAQCKRADSIEEVCEVRGARLSGERKRDFGETWRNALIGAGYVAFIAPGVILWFVFNHQSNVAGEDAERDGEAERAACRAGR